MGSTRTSHDRRASSADAARRVFRLVDALEDLDDVQDVYANFDVSDDVLALVD